MPDNQPLSLETTPERSTLMKRVRQRDTDPERRVRALLRDLGIRYRTNVLGLPGRPDIAHKGRRKAIFVNGCYWHNHTLCGRGKVPKSNPDFWESKFRQNRLRDQRKIDALRAEGFDVLVVWECELADPALLRERLLTFWQGLPVGPDHRGPHPSLEANAQPPVETFTLDSRKGLLIRWLLTRSGDRRKSLLPMGDPVTDVDLGAAYDLAWLTAPTRPQLPAQYGQVSIVDLFSGCGAMTVGVLEACRALGLAGIPTIAVDTAEGARRVYADNYPEAKVHATDINDLLPGSPGERLRSEEQRLLKEAGTTDILLAGPPCQGNSDLNNHTRRSDPKNRLFMKMARCAEVLSPTHIILENVKGVLHDSDNVFARTCDYLARLDYQLDSRILKGEFLGVPQRRHRVFLVASRQNAPNLGDLSTRFATLPRSTDWAIRDLLFEPHQDDFDRPSVPSVTNRRRMEYLFVNGLFDLPDEERPPCHRLKQHTYSSTYGRMRPHEPAPTITTGFPSMGQGRFVHPYRRRTITPHEAARLQFIPDFFRFGSLRRTEYRTLIGNAVPPKFTYLIALELLR